MISPPLAFSTIQDPSIWASLAAMAMAAKELGTAEIAFAAIDEVDKLHFVVKVKQVRTKKSVSGGQMN